MRQAFTSLAYRALLCIFLLPATFTLALASATPAKSPNDHNRYRIVTLDNGLQALLISNPATETAAAAMDVATGSGDDPEARPGLAHFLEHMLFLGTRKYPQPDAYQTFISKHGGDHNAMTMFQHTNYFFDISADALAPALDRFAQQFTAPLFNSEYVSREKHAVASEYRSKRKLDGLRYYSAYRQALNPDHPLSRFAVGNLKTLADRPDESVRQDLVRFYRHHYSANTMKLVVYGKQPLDQLEKMVRGRFSEIPNRHLKPTRYTMPLFRPASLPALLKVKSIKDRRDLSLVFPIPSSKQAYPFKPVDYVANLLGHEGQGSLLDVLKRAGLAQSLSAGQGTDTGDGSTFNLDIALTKAGFRDWKKVVALSFDFINKVRDQGIKALYFDENRRLAGINFRYHEKSQPIDLVSRLARRLQDVRPDDVLRAPYMYTHYAPDAYRQVLDRLTPDNVLLSVMSPAPLKGDVRKTRWYDTPYELASADMKQLLAEGADGKLEKQLALPEPNPFIPDRLSLVPGKTMARPEQLQSAPISLWYARDTSFGTPKADVYINLRSPIANGSPRDADLTRLLVRTVQDQLDSFTYPARLAGLRYDIYPHLRGITVRVGGYDEKIHVLLEKVLAAVMHPQLSEAQFRIHKQQLLESLKNTRQNQPYNQAMSRTQELLLSNLWTDDARLKAARDLKLADLKRFSTRFGKALQPVMLAHGNLTRASALTLANMSTALTMEHAKLVDVPRTRVFSLPTNSNLHFRWPVDHPDTGYVRYFQGSDTSFRQQADFLLLGQVLSSPFYDSLRTRQQLGYVVFATPFPLLDVPGLGLIIESPKAGPEKLDQQVGEFLKGYRKRLETMPEKSFKQHQQAVISRLEEKPKQLQDVSERYWGEIDRANYRFDSRSELIKAVRKRSREDIVRLYSSDIVPERRSLLVTTSKDASEDGNGRVRTLVRHEPFVQ